VYKYCRRYNSARGALLLLVLIYVFVLSIIVTSAARFALHEKRLAARSSIYTDELAAAEYAINKLYSELDFLSRFHTPGLNEFNERVAEITIPAIPGFNLTSDEPIKVSGFFTGDPTGEFNSPYVFNYKYRLRTNAKRTDATSKRFIHDGVEVEQIVYMQYIPLTMFGIFSNTDWEIIPGNHYEMHGKVHGNKNWIFDTDGGHNSYFYDTVTAAGKLLGGAGRVPGRSDKSRGVNFTYDKKNFKKMFRDSDGKWIDHELEGWHDIALEQWDGYVRDSAHGVSHLDLSIPWTEDPHAIVERRSDEDTESMRHVKFDWLSGIRIVRETDGELRAYARKTIETEWHSVPLEFPDPENPINTLSPVSADSRFYDYREERYVQVLDLDIQVFQEYTEWLSNEHYIDFNGILYASELSFDEDMPAVRIENGESIPDSGLIIATDNPLYVHGHFNVDKNYALLAGDSVTVLSRNWKDSDNLNPYRPHIPGASATTTNAIFIAGITPTDARYPEGQQYSGGAENFFRYLESWGSHTFYGSIINMFASQTAVGRWRNPGEYYKPPQRHWNWDSFGFNHLEGTPYVRRILRSEWRIVPKV